MREIFTSGSVGGAPGNRCFYLERDKLPARFFEVQSFKFTFSVYPSWLLQNRLPLSPVVKQKKWSQKF